MTFSVAGFVSGAIGGLIVWLSCQFVLLRYFRSKPVVASPPKTTQLREIYINQLKREFVAKRGVHPDDSEQLAKCISENADEFATWSEPKIEQARQSFRLPF